MRPIEVCEVKHTLLQDVIFKIHTHTYMRLSPTHTHTHTDSLLHIQNTHTHTQTPSYTYKHTYKHKLIHKHRLSLTNESHLSHRPTCPPCGGTSWWDGGGLRTGFGTRSSSCAVCSCAHDHPAVMMFNCAMMIIIIIIKIIIITIIIILTTIILSSSAVAALLQSNI